MQGFMNLRRH